MQWAIDHIEIILLPLSNNTNKGSLALKNDIQESVALGNFTNNQGDILGLEDSYKRRNLPGE